VAPAMIDVPRWPAGPDVWEVVSASAGAARAQERAIVTANVADFTGERDVVLVFVLKKNPSGRQAGIRSCRSPRQMGARLPGPVSRAALADDRITRGCALSRRFHTSRILSPSL
jgi:hypothetical protein